MSTHQIRSATDPAYLETTQAEALRQMFLNVKSVTLFMPLLPTLLVAGVWTRVPSSLALLWLVVDVAILVARSLVCRAYFRAPPAAPDVPRWGSRMTWLTAADGIAWGIAGNLLFVSGDLPMQLLLLTMIVGIPAGAIYSTSWWPTMHHVYAGASLGLTATGLIARGSVGEIMMGLGFIVYLVILHFIVREANGSAMETIALRFDKQELIDQLQHEKEIAERANLAKSKFLAAASHDLRQPLHAMTLFVAAMNDRAQPPETRAMIGNVQRCATALDSLLQTLLDISKIDAGVIEPQFVNFRLAPLLDRLVAEFGPQAQAAGLVLAVHHDSEVAHSDPALVERILRNLISNAIRYTQAGSITVCCRADSAGIAIEVNDTGVGIPADQQERVFDEFVQLGNPERDRSKGLGLGLAIVRRLAGLLHVPLTLDSTPGRGSIFRIVVPVGDPTAVIEHNRDQPDAALSLDGMTVAVIDDEADVREGMITLLKEWGCRVAAGEDAETVIAALSGSGVLPDVVLADYRLRGNTTGVDAINALLGHFQAVIPAAIITGDTAPERLVEAQASGHLLLHKPLRPAKLRVLLQNLRRGAARSA